MISPYQATGRHRSWLPTLGSMLLAATLVTGCTAASSTPAPSSSGRAGPGSAAFRQCLQRNGVSVPRNRPTPGSGRPTGAGSSAFRKALQACGGSFHGGGGTGPNG